MAEATKAVAILGLQEGNTVYPHTLISVGIPEDDRLGKIVLAHVLMGDHTFEFRLTLENARGVARALTKAAEAQETGTPLVPGEPLG